MQVFAWYLTLKGEKENVGGWVLEAGTDEETDVALFLHGIMKELTPVSKSTYSVKNGELKVSIHSI